MSEHRKPVYPSAPWFNEAVYRIYDDFDGLELSFEQILRKMKAEFIAERDQLRARILEQACLRSDASSPYKPPQTCPYFLTFRFRDAWLDVYWVKTCFTGDPASRLRRRLQLSSGNTSIDVLLEHAHPDEVDTIRRHEERARLIRQQWKEYAEIRKKLKSFCSAHIGAE